MITFIVLFEKNVLLDLTGTNMKMVGEIPRVWHQKPLLQSPQQLLQRLSSEKELSPVARAMRPLPTSTEIIE
jgi:hypothetical protein